MQPHAFAGFSDPISSWSHLLTAVMGIFGAVLLFRRGRGNALRMTSLGIFSFCLIFLFSMSGVYHLLDRQGLARPVMQRMDIAAIWTMIAGTFTPIHIILFRGLWRWGMILLIWVIAITGLVLHVVFFNTFPMELALALFVAMGWLGAFSMLHYISKFRDRAILVMLGGGVSYTVGAVFEYYGTTVLIEGIIGAHEIFHLFVVLGAYLHWRFIYHWAAHPVRDTIDIDIHSYPRNRHVAIGRSDYVRLRARDMDGLKRSIRQVVRAKYHPRIHPRIRLHFHKDEVLN